MVSRCRSGKLPAPSIRLELLPLALGELHFDPMYAHAVGAPYAYKTRLAPEYSGVQDSTPQQAVRPAAPPRRPTPPPQGPSSLQS